MFTALLVALLLSPAFACQDEPALDDRFASEPTRTKANAPVSFTKSWTKALEESTRTGRRILAVFTGDHCGWCRVLEKRTFTDQEVVSATTSFVCVEINVGDEANARIVDRYRIETIPRSFVLPRPN